MTHDQPNNSIIRDVSSRAIVVDRTDNVSPERLLRFGVQSLHRESILCSTRLRDSLPRSSSGAQCLGNLSVLCNRTYTILCSNGADNATLLQLEQAADAMAKAGWTAVTGHNRDAYRRLALAQTRANGSTIFVLDRGIARAFDERFEFGLFGEWRVHKLIFDRHQDLAISPFKPTDHGLGRNNRIRDTMIADLADQIVVGYIRKGGVMEYLVTRAERSGRSMLSLSDVPRLFGESASRIPNI